MREWMNLVENAGRYYMRFGEIPENERSGIGRSPNWIHARFRTSDEEEGVSCYWTTYDQGKEQWVIEDVGNHATLDELIHLADEGKRKIYIVTGDELDETGADQEPLLRNVKIIKQVESVKELFVPGFYDGKEVEKQVEYRCKDLWIMYEDGDIRHETDTSITEEELEEMLGWTASYNGIEKDDEILFRCVDTSGKSVNEKATEKLSQMMGRQIDPPLRGRAIVLKGWTKHTVHR